jgi:hypothetical protein
MKPGPAFFLAAALALAAGTALAQPGPGGPHPGPYGGYYGPREFHHQMPPPERRMSWEERQRLREQVRSGAITREEARQRWREQRGMEPGRFSPEQREQLRRDVQDANRDLEKR